MMDVREKEERNSGIEMDQSNLEIFSGKNGVVLQEKVSRKQTRYEFRKRILDILSGIIGILAFVFIYIILFIPYHIGANKGPIMFTQKRIGKNGELFSIYKFRSMRCDADEHLHANKELYLKYIQNDYKLEPHEDPRITRLGLFLRKTSLDELPQFINVLKGEMSIVGPRPIVQEELKEYMKQNKVQEFIAMKPGITGVWQTNGRSNVGYPERVDLEISYSQNESLLFDLNIIWKTFGKVFRKEGAY